MLELELSIPTPCAEGWASMAGDERSRFCERCEKQVVNLSALTEREAVEALSGPPICVRFEASASGRVKHRAEADERPADARIRFRPASAEGRGLRAALMTLALALPLASSAPAYAGDRGDEDEPGLLARVASTLRGEHRRAQRQASRYDVHPDSQDLHTLDDLYLEEDEGYYIIGEPAPRWRLLRRRHWR